MKPTLAIWFATLLCTAQASYAVGPEPLRLGSVGVDAETPPTQVENVKIVEKMGAQVPTQVIVRDEQGKPGQLSDFLNDHLPVILTFNYSNCPHLCSLQLGGVVTSLSRMNWLVGEQFRVVTILLDPNESDEKVQKTKALYLSRYTPKAQNLATGWRFLRASDAVVAQLADSVGFAFTRDAKNGEIYHPAVIMVLTPSGQVASYMYGIDYPAETLEPTLFRAGLGQNTESAVKFLMACFHAIPRKSHTAAAISVMRWGGGGFVLASFIGFLFWKRGRRSSSKIQRGLVPRESAGN